MKAYNKEYEIIFKDLSNVKDILEYKIDKKSDKYNDWFEANFVLDNFRALYYWGKMEFTILNADTEDLESMIGDLKEYKCETFADFAIIYMQNYIDKLHEFIIANDYKEMTNKFTKEEENMENIYVGIYIQDNELTEVVTGTDKDMLIKFMKDLADEIFEENQDKVYVYLNNQEIWSYES